MLVQDAITQIDSIWSHLARTERFRGYRPETVASTGILGVLAALGQPVLCPDPRLEPDRYIDLWAGVAIVCVVLVAIELIHSYLSTPSNLERQLTRRAVLQFFPCLCAGALLTWILPASSANSLFLLPGLWSLCFSLGVFASIPFISPAILWVAGYYLVAGGLWLSFSQSSVTLQPWVMGGTFGIGQLLMAAILWRSEKRPHGPE